VWCCCRQGVPKWCRSAVLSGALAQFQTCPRSSVEILIGRNLNASSASGRGRSLPLSITGESPESAPPLPPKGLPPSQLSVNGLTRSRYPPELPCAASSSTLSPSPLPRTMFHTRERNTDKRENTEGRVLRPPLLFFQTPLWSCYSAALLPFFQLWAPLRELLETA
jgi:hypothetical protein